MFYPDSDFNPDFIFDNIDVDFRFNLSNRISDPTR